MNTTRKGWVDDRLPRAYVRATFQRHSVSVIGDSCEVLLLPRGEPDGDLLRISAAVANGLVPVSTRVAGKRRKRR